jgi:hypothetical protein
MNTRPVLSMQFYQTDPSMRCRFDIPNPYQQMKVQAK